MCRRGNDLFLLKFRCFHLQLHIICLQLNLPTPLEEDTHTQAQTGTDIQTSRDSEPLTWCTQWMQQAGLHVHKSVYLHSMCSLRTLLGNYYGKSSNNPPESLFILHLSPNCVFFHLFVVLHCYSELSKAWSHYEADKMWTGKLLELLAASLRSK